MSATAGLLFGVVASAAYTVATVLTSHGGAAPTSGPARSGGPGGFGAASESSETLKSMVMTTENRWAAASVGSQEAGALELSTGASIMAIGGFTGGDNSPTLAQFQQYVDNGQIRYFLAGDNHGPGGQDADSSGSRIAERVQDNFVAQNVDGTTIYDLQG